MRRRDTKSEARLAGYLIVGIICFPILLIYLILKALEEIANLFDKLSKTKINKKFNIKFSQNVQEQLSRIDYLDGWEFENYIACLLKRNGYRNVNVTRGSGDFGADIIAEKNSEKIAFQCKRFSDKVGPKVIGEVLRGMNKYNCTKGIIVTNNFFTEQAIKESKISNVELWDKDKIISILNDEEKRSTLNSNKFYNTNKKIICPWCKAKNNSKRTNCWICGKSILNSEIINENNYNDDVEKEILLKELCIYLNNLKNSKESSKNRIDPLEVKDNTVNVNSNYVDKNNCVRLCAGEYEIPEDLNSGCYSVYLKNGTGSLSLEDKSGERKKYLSFGNENTYEIFEYNNLEIKEDDMLIIDGNCSLILEKVESKKVDLNNIKAGLYNVPNNIESGKYRIMLKNGTGTLSLEDKFGERKKYLVFGNENTYKISEYNNLRIYEGDNLEIDNSCILQFIKNGDIKNNKEQKNKNIVEEKNKDKSILKKDIEQYDITNKSKGKIEAITYIIENIEYSYYSFKNLLDELKIEGFSEELAISAIESCEIDWNEQALKCINEMISYSDEYTPNDLRDDLECENFEEENINYALRNCKVDWNIQAVKTAKKYKKENNYSREEIIEFLIDNDGYTSIQAQYGIKNTVVE